MRQLREERQLPMKYVAQQLDVSLSHYSQVETGDKQPSLNLSLRIKRFYDYYDDDIFDNV